MNRQSFIFLFSIVLYVLAGCSQEKKQSYVAAEKIAVQWELISNLIDDKNTFEAKFTLTNNSNAVLADTNWALFFNMSPRPILANQTPQAGKVQHINGDWYKLTPGTSFLSGSRKIGGYSIQGNRRRNKRNRCTNGTLFCVV
jgi:hexosaminidase